MNEIYAQAGAAPEAAVDSRATICLRYLAMCKEEMARANRNRIYYIRLSRQHGVSDSQIADAIGVPADALAQLVSEDS